MRSTIRILIADDQKQARVQVRALVKRHQRMQVIAEAGNGYEVMTLVQKHSPDIVLMDVTMPGLDGLQALERIKQDGLRTKVIIVSGRTSRTWVGEARRLGAKGYVAKQDLEDGLIQAIEAVVNGEWYVSRLLQQERDKAPTPLSDGENMELQQQQEGVREPSRGKRVRGQLQVKQNGSTQHGREKVRILILDDDPLVLDHISTTHKGDTQLEIVPYGQELVKRDPNTALQVVAQDQPDVILLDLIWQDGKQSGWPMLKHLRDSYPHIPVIIFSNSSKRIHVNEAVEMGARGYVAKIDWVEHLVSAILEVHKGETYYSPSVPRPEICQLEELSLTENKVFKLHVKGHTRKEIAQKLSENKHGYVDRASVDDYFFYMKDKIGDSEGWKGVARAAYGVLWELDARECELFGYYVKGTTVTEKLAQTLKIPETVVRECIQTMRRKLRCPPWKWRDKAEAKKAQGDQELLCELNARERELFDRYVRGMTTIDKLAEAMEIREILVKECMQTVRRKLRTHPEGWKGIARELRLID